VLALSAVSANVFFKKGKGAFDFIQSPAAMAILGSYIVAYTIRIYIMNYYKNTRTQGGPQDNKGFFAIEQFAAAGTLFVIAILVFSAPQLFGWNPPQVDVYRRAILEPRPLWGWAFASGIFYGLVAFVSVFIFMFKGRTATFVGLANRLTSLVAGTVATLVFHFAFGGKAPSVEEWFSLGLIFAAVFFLARAEHKRSFELAQSR
jgi:drug/metabolite transporter (DMT)-like permease